MNILLDAIEARVIGSLMEKSLITPEQYPLSLNALVAACNQRTSREPVMDLSEADVQAALDRLRARYLVREKSGFGSRVAKYHYRLYNDEIGDFRLSDGERALVCLLLLRGPQTAAELRSRTSRMHPFADAEEVERVLERLMAYEQGPFVIRLPREAGRRESRWAQCFTADAEPSVAAAAGAEPASLQAPTGRPAPEDLGGRVARLEERVAVLEASLEALLDHRHSGGG